MPSEAYRVCIKSLTSRGAACIEFNTRKLTITLIIIYLQLAYASFEIDLKAMFYSLSRLLHDVAYSVAHNEKERKISKIAPPMAPKDNRAWIDTALCNAGLPH